MMVKLSKFERVAGVFISVCIIGSAVIGVSAAIKQGWFEKKVFYTAVFENADGVHIGTQVQISGLRAGVVDDVELQNDNNVRVKFYILGKFKNKIKTDSVAQLVRPFIVGERILDVSVGGLNAPELAENQEIKSSEAVDLMALLSGKKMNSYVSKISSMFENVQALAEAFLDKNRTQSMVKIFDKLDPLLDNVTLMSNELIKLSRQATKDRSLEKLLYSLNRTTDEINKILPEMNKENPEIAKNLAQMLRDVSEISHSATVLAPAFQEIGPDMPMAARRAIEALNETVVMMKAAQKSILMRGSVKEVREEQAEEELKRKPAGAK